MKNFPIKDKDGKEYWISRAVCVLGCIFTEINGVVHVLANKRGKGTPDFQGCWNMPCGYLDFDETTKEAVMREVYEETGVVIQAKDLKFWKFKDKPEDDARQNISFRYFAMLDAQPSLISVGSNNRGGEENEVEAVSWIPLDKIYDYQWAFNHDKIIEELINDIQEYAEGTN